MITGSLDLGGGVVKAALLTYLASYKACQAMRVRF
jgi:hypothetical protein